jgi:hypothetical protein
MTTENKAKTFEERINDIIKAAAEHNYYPNTNQNGYTMATCYDCQQRLIKKYGAGKWRAATKDKKTPNTALVLTNKSTGAKVLACPCGFRKSIDPGVNVRKNPVNKTFTPKKPVRKCHTKGCNVILPAERKMFCYKCRPAAKNVPAKKEAQPEEKVIY